MPIIAAGLTDIGRKRKTNQDAIYLNSEKHIFVVADGMGGHNGGDIASQMAVKYIPEFLLKHIIEEQSTEVVRNSIRFANAAIYRKSKSDPKLVGMGTTSVTLFFKGDSLFLGNVGDSRAYLLNNKMLYQLSVDHSLVQEKLAMSIIGNVGEYTRQTAVHDPQKNIIVRTVGFEEQLEVDVFQYKVSRNDMVLICSDGLHGRVSDRDILTIVNRHVPDPKNAEEADLQNAVKQLVHQANLNGGNDNISVIIALAK